MNVCTIGGMMIKALLFNLLWACVVPSLAAEKTSPPTGIDFYEVVEAGKENARPFEIHFQMTGEIIKGAYRGDPIISAKHIAKINVEEREFVAAPAAGLAITFRSEAAQMLARYEGDNNPSVLLLIFDGVPWETLHVSTLKRIMKKSGAYFVFAPKDNFEGKAKLEENLKQIRKGVP